MLWPKATSHSHLISLGFIYIFMRLSGPVAVKCVVNSKVLHNTSLEMNSERMK